MPIKRVSVRLALGIMLLIAVACALIGCETMPTIKDGELILNATTSATVEDGAVARINNKF